MMRTLATLLLSVPLLAATPREGDAPALPYAEAVERIVHAERDGQWEEALAGTRALLEEAEARGLTEYQRAELHFAAGVVLASRRDLEEPEELARALAPFETARALAGPGPLRLDAGYDLGVTELLRGERYRARLPELGGAPPVAPPGVAGAPGAPSAGEEQADPLAQARSAYRAARERLLVRLRSDWRDADTRANLELIQRRLHELDRIEEQRRQQQDPNQPQDQSQEQDPNQKQDQQPPEQEQQPDDEGDRKPGDESSEPEEGGDDAKQDPASPPPEQGEQGEQETDPLETNAAEAEPPPGEGEEQAAPAERRLTKEEVMRLLQSLEGIEERGEALQKILGKARREAVKRDW